MHGVPFFSRRFAVGLLLAGWLLTPLRIAAQAAQGGTDHSATTDAQATLAQLQTDLKAAQAKGDAKAEAETLGKIGDIYARLGDGPHALDSYNRSATFYRAAGDRAGEAATLKILGNIHFALGERQEAIDSYNLTLPIYRALGDRAAEAITLANIGIAYDRLGAKQKALDFYGQALSLYRAVGDRAGEATMLIDIGYLSEHQGEVQKAIDDYTQALSLYRAQGDRSDEAIALEDLGTAQGELGQHQKALDEYNQALLIRQETGSRDGVAATLTDIGSAYKALGQPQKALDYYNQALPIRREVRDRAGEATALNNIGATYKDLGDLQKALDYSSQSLAIHRVLGDRSGEASNLSNIGSEYDDLGEKQKALDYYNQALTIFRQLGDRRNEATALNNIAYLYSNQGEKQKALDSFNQALPIYRAVGDRDGEATTLGNIGVLYWSLGQNQKALDIYNQTLLIEREVGDRRGEAVALNNIGLAYSDLGQPRKALDYFTQALPIVHEAGARSVEATTLSNIGGVYYELGQNEKALKKYKEALEINRAVSDKSGEAATLINIGNIESGQQALDSLNQALSLARQVGDRREEAMALANESQTLYYRGEKTRAIETSEQALQIQEEIGDRSGEVFTLIQLGDLNGEIGEKQKQLEILNRALPLATAIADPLLEAEVSYDLLRCQKASQPAMAIFFGKQAVNLLQQVRGNIKGLDKTLEKSFLASKTDYYHDLADLLITQNRLPEAQQVLDLLKQQEYSDYTRGTAADTLSPLTLTPAEQQAEEQYQESTAQLVSMGKQFDDLSKKNPRSPDDEKKFQDLKAKLDAASAGLSGYYDRLHVLFAKTSDFNKQKAEIKGDVRALQSAIGESPRTVALYTMITADHYRVIVITASVVPVAREYAISAADLNRKVAAFDELLHNPASDPRPAAQELYNILIGPVKADLDQANADTLVWSLDGALRYLPLAALYDGKNYLVEKYSNVTITPASFGLLAQKPDVSKLSVVAMGISRQYEEHLPALPAVVGELDDVVKDPQMQAAHGVLPGTILLNGQFTQKAMEDALNGRYKVVHIASHFVFQPGDDSKSYLLLASNDNASLGYHLTVEDFSNDPSLKLESTDLLTLSACQTGMSGDASNGREVDGLGMTAQYKGARAVISSLWSVNDASTGQLMSDFYKRWAGGGGNLSKVQALRQAQLDLLHGSVSGTGSASGRGFNLVEKAGPVSAGFTHPYYWAPFVLMGNWQ